MSSISELSTCHSAFARQFIHRACGAFLLRRLPISILVCVIEFILGKVTSTRYGRKIDGTKFRGKNLVAVQTFWWRLINNRAKLRQKKTKDKAVALKVTIDRHAQPPLTEHTCACLRWQWISLALFNWRFSKRTSQGSGSSRSTRNV